MSVFLIFEPYVFLVLTLGAATRAMPTRSESRMSTCSSACIASFASASLQGRDIASAELVNDPVKNLGRYWPASLSVQPQLANCGWYRDCSQVNASTPLRSIHWPAGGSCPSWA